MEYIAFFLEKDSNPLLFGGKGSNLILLSKIGANVPPGFIVNAHAYDKFLKESEYADRLKKLLSKKEFQPRETLQISAEIQDLMLKSTFPNVIREELERAHKKILEKEGEKISFAVRSSATVEDSSKFSFAGQADTFLYNNSLEQIIKSLKECWKSLFSTRSLLYFLQMKKKGFNISLSEVKMAVVIQKMINSDVASILFTVNVVNNDQNQMMINSSWGLGDSIADNSVSPDTIILNKQKFEIVKITIGTKEQKSVRKPEGSGTIIVDVNPDLRKTCSLNESQLRAIHALGLKIEKAMGCPQDIELAIENDFLYVLQARPITTLKT